MPLPELSPDHLVVLVFGIGIGELILVRVPPDVWMVVDGCGIGGHEYAPRALEHYKAHPRIVILTHPHDDHCGGLASVIEAETPRDQKAGWPRIGMVTPPSEDAARTGGAIGRSTQDAIAAIEARWSESPACRWEMKIGDEEPLGEAKLRVLSPRDNVRNEALERWRKGKPFDKNIISTALLLTWRQRRIVLGSDLVEHPAEGWSHCLSLDPELGDHDLLKVAHHGSDDAQHDGMLLRKPKPQPLRIIAPFSPKQLPQFRTHGKGGSRIVAKGGPVYLTGLPRAHVDQSGCEERRDLAELLEHDTLHFSQKTPGFPDCFVMVSIPSDGAEPIVKQGPGSIQVVL